MALKGQAKTDYQREYMRRKRGQTVRPASSALDLVLDPNQDKLAALREMMEPDAIMSRFIEARVTAHASTLDLPIYNPKKHQEGDVVRKWSNGKWIEVTVPALDMDGNVIEDDE